MIKDFISDQDGLYRDPFNAAVIKGDDRNTNLISKYVSDPFAVISPDGARIVPARTPKTKIKGNIAVEMPFNTNQMNYAQEGGAASQQQQIVQQVAQMLQQGADPQQVMQQLVKMGIPSEQAEQLLTAVMQQMQSAMAEQEQMQDEDMGGQEQMPMAKDGGCIDCEEQFPQAQNLNWFYKAQGGEAFPQANLYPHMYADGGEAFPQAQTYLPYDRGGNPSPNFMFEYGGTTDIDQAYQIMKRGGFDMNPKKKKGGKFTDETFDEYVMRNGGKLPMHQWQNSQTGFGFGQPDATQVYRPNIQLNGLQQVPNLQQGKPNPFLINNQQSFANQYPAAMQNIMNATQPMGQQARPAATQSAAGARTAGSASGVKRTPTKAPAAAPAAVAPAATSTSPQQIILSGANNLSQPQGSYNMWNQQQQVQQPNNQNFESDEGSDYDQSSGDGFPTVTMDKKGNITPNQRQAYYNPFQAYLAGKNLPRLLGNKAAAGLGLLGPIIPGFGNAITAGTAYGDGLLGRRDKFKASYVGPDGSRENVKVKGRESIANVFGYQDGGAFNWKYSTFDPAAGMEGYLGNRMWESGIITGLDQKKLKEEQDKLRNQDTVSSGIAMGPIAAKTPGNAAVGTTNFMGAVNPFMSGQPGNFGLGTYGSSMLSNAKFGGNILDQFQDGAEVDLDGMSEQQIRDFVEAVYAAGGTVEYL